MKLVAETFGRVFRGLKLLAEVRVKELHVNWYILLAVFWTLKLPYFVQLTLLKLHRREHNLPVIFLVMR